MNQPIPDELLEVMAEKFRLLGDATRLAILRAVMAGEKNVSQIVAETGRSQANVSKHLKLLADARLLQRRRQGLKIFYHLSDPVVARVCALVCDTILNEMKEQLERQRRLLHRSRRNH